MSSTDAVSHAQKIARLLVEKLSFLHVTGHSTDPTPTARFIDGEPDAIAQVRAVLESRLPDSDHSAFIAAIETPSDELAQCLTILAKGTPLASSDSRTKLGDAAFCRKLVEQIRAAGSNTSNPPAFEQLKQAFRTTTEAAVSAAIDAIGAAPPTEPPAEAANFSLLGRIEFDRRAGAAADRTVQTATHGKLSSLNALVKHVEAAENEIIRLSRSAQDTAAGPAVLSDASTGTPMKVKAFDVFKDAVARQEDRDLLDFEITTYLWPAGQAKIPAIDPHYHFDIPTLRTVLYGIEHGKNCALVGPPGAGKTDMTKQIAARLNRPYFRVPIDGEMRRREMIGGMKQFATATGSEMRFVDGVLIQAMRLPSIICFDEFDRMDPDLAYLMHQALEGEGITLLDDGERFIAPHPKLAMIGTANTKGVADSLNRFNMTSELSEATRDRFTFWLNVTYLGQENEVQILTAKAPGITTDEARQIRRFAELMRTAYLEEKIRTACSLRQLLEVARYGAFVRSLPEAVSRIMIDRAATIEDEAAIRQIAHQIYGAAIPDQIQRAAA